MAEGELVQLGELLEADGAEQISILNEELAANGLERGGGDRQQAGADDNEVPLEDLSAVDLEPALQNGGDGSPGIDGITVECGINRVDCDIRCACAVTAAGGDWRVSALGLW